MASPDDDLLRRLDVLDHWFESLRIATTRDDTWLLTNDAQPKQAHELLREARARIAQMAQELDVLAGKERRQFAWAEEYMAKSRSLELKLEEAEAQLRAAEARVREESAIVDRVWRALGITTMEEAGGKSIDELVAKLKQAEALRAAEKQLWKQERETW